MEKRKQSMQIIYEEPELAPPFDIRSDPQRRQCDREPELLDTFVDRLWWMVVGYVGAILILAAIGALL